MSIAQAPTAQTRTAEELASVVVDNMTAAEIRAWMSNNHMKRSRGARKMQSAMQAIDQNRAIVENLVRHLEGDYSVTCTCGMDRTFATAKDAKDLAKAHKSLNNRHFPRARGPENERIYG